jgi:hypothetical protein
VTEEIEETQVDLQAMNDLHEELGLMLKIEAQKTNA